MTVSALMRGSIISLGLIASASTLRADDDAALIARVQAAETATSIDAAGLNPWHMKATVQVFDSKGKPTQQGKIEEWWRSPSVDRREYTLGTYSMTEIRAADKMYRTVGFDLPPYYLALLRSEIVHPLHLPDASIPSWPVLRKVNMSKFRLECIALRSSEHEAPLEARNYCFGPKPNGIWLSTNYAHQFIARDTIGRFQGRYVPMEASVFYNGVRVAAAKVEMLETESIADYRFEHSADVQEVSPPIVEAGENAKTTSAPSTIAGSQLDPVYPEEASQRRLSGAVLLRGVLTTNGLIRNVEVIASTDPLFESAATSAVQKRAYKPVLWNAHPAELEMMISIDFDIR